MTEGQLRVMFEAVRDKASTFHPDMAQYTLHINASKRQLGSCNYRTRTITVSKWHIQGSSMDAVHDTLLHEFAHALSYAREGQKGWNHGPHWKKACGDLGANASRVSHQAYDIKRPPAKYTLSCPHCGIEESRHRMRKGAKYACGRCGGDIEIIQHW